MKVVKLSTLMGLASLGIFAAACGGKSPKDRIVAADLQAIQSLRDVKEAPANLQEAASAIVRIRGVSGGTGTFVNHPLLGEAVLMTNNHVVGAANCARIGCYFSIFVDFQIGKKSTDAEIVYAEPLLSSPDLDVSFFRLYRTHYGVKTGDRFLPRVALAFEPKTPQEIVSLKTHVIGHPLGAVKKWTLGEGFRAEENWVYTTNYIFSGNSGSPILNDDGKIVGIVHRSPSSDAYLTRKDVRTMSIGSASRSILDLINEGNLASKKGVSEFLDVEAPIAPNEFMNSASIYFSARKKPIWKTEWAGKNVLEILAEKCDADLAATKITKFDDYFVGEAACRVALGWIGCNTSNMVKNSVRECPTENEITRWKERFHALELRSTQVSGLHPFNWVSAPARFEKTVADENRVDKEQLWKHLEQHKPALSFALANEILAVADKNVKPTYQGVDIVDYILNYQKQPKYEYSLETIFGNHLLAYAKKLIKLEETVAGLRRLYFDEKATIDERLSIESRLYASEWLELVMNPNAKIEKPGSNNQ